MFQLEDYLELKMAKVLAKQVEIAIILQPERNTHEVIDEVLTATFKDVPKSYQNKWIQAVKKRQS